MMYKYSDRDTVNVAYSMPLVHDLQVDKGANESNPWPFGI